MKVARWADPDFMKKVPTAEIMRNELNPLVDKLIDGDEVDNLIKQMPDYQMSAMLFQPQAKWEPKVDCIVQYWQSYKAALNHWYEFARKCFLLQPSSASVERAFSMLKSIYGKQKSAKLEETVEIELMLRYNNRVAKKKKSNEEHLKNNGDDEQGDEDDDERVLVLPLNDW